MLLNFEKQDKDSPLEDFDLENPIDTKKSLARFQGNHRLYYNLLRRLETMTLNQSMVKVAACIDERDWSELQSLVLKLRSPFYYVGVGRLYNTCHQIYEASSLKQVERILELYQLLVEESIMYKRYSRKLLSEYFEEPYCEKASARVVAVAEGF